MALCGALSYGFDYNCNTGIGGIAPGTILAANWDDIASSTVANGIVTAITMESGKQWFRYQVRKQIAGDTTNGVADPLTGTKSYTSNMVFTLFGIEAVKNTELEKLMSGPTVWIYQDNNDVYHILGLNYGAEVKTIDRTTGTAMTDMNGYTITVMHEEDAFPYEVQAAVVSGLDISGVLS